MFNQIKQQLIQNGFEPTILVGCPNVIYFYDKYSTHWPIIVVGEVGELKGTVKCQQDNKKYDFLRSEAVIESADQFIPALKRLIARSRKFTNQTLNN